MSDRNPKTTGDLTRWNRAGLSRLDYVDGDAANWLEEMRLALLGLYLRGEPVEDRLPEAWRDVFAKDKAAWQTDARLTELAASLAWSRLLPPRPPVPESRGQRGQRLRDQYGAKPDGDYAWEILRAFARAAHVHLGHVNAFAGEGYLRTATQWDNLRRLAGMVNYQPTPPASAATNVALELDAGAGVTELARGLAAKYAPPQGGAPLIFETLESLVAHPALSAARVVDFALNTDLVPLGDDAAGLAVAWATGPKDILNPGDLVVLAQGDSGHARQVTLSVAGDGVTRVTLDHGQPPAADLTMSTTELWCAPEAVRLAEARSGEGTSQLEMARPLGLAAGAIVQLKENGTTKSVMAEVVSTNGTVLSVKTAEVMQGSWSVQALAPYAADQDGWVLVGPDVDEVHFAGPNGITKTRKDLQAYSMPNVKTEDESPNQWMRAPGFRANLGFVEDKTSPTVSAQVRAPAPQVVATSAPDPSRTASFLGKPPKSLRVGAWFVSRAVATGARKTLRVQAVSTTAEGYHILFDATYSSPPNRTEFHGPMLRALRPVGHDRNPHPLPNAASADLTGLPADAQALVKPGRRMILSRLDPEGGRDDAEAVVTTVTRGAALRLTFSTATDIAGWAMGDMTFRLNVVPLGHGETQPPRLLGSGDAERPEQSFRLPVADVSHVASTLALSGVVPDMDVAVDGTVWAFRDYADFGAEGAKAWSSTLTETGEIEVHFRRRLPTGSNNVTILRHRTGTGAKGSGVPALAFDKPMKKHAQVTGIYQPFPTSGGADREAVASLRSAAPARLSANGRAVSRADFERLAASLASVWQARAVEVQDGGALRHLELTVVPANDDALTAGLEASLRASLLAGALPGVRLTFRRYQPLPLILHAEVRADLVSYDASDVKAACEAALSQAFGLAARRFDQPAYRSEIMAVLETVPQVTTAIVTAFGLVAGAATPANVIERDGAIAAIFPAFDQVIHLAGPGASGLTTSNLSITVRGLT